MTAQLTSLPSYERTLAGVAEAEQGIGWAAACAEAGRHVALNGPFVEALAEALRDVAQPLHVAQPPPAGLFGPMDTGTAEGGCATPVLEVCAGNGELADALRAEGVDVIATDVDPPAGSSVIAMSAAEALRRFRPAVVLGSFVPFDAGVDQAVLSTSSVEQYITINARLGGRYGSEALWRRGGWESFALPDVARWMICRHDVWMGEEALLRHGEVWRFTRSSHGQAPGTLLAHATPPLAHATPGGGPKPRKPSLPGGRGVHRG